MKKITTAFTLALVAATFFSGSVSAAPLYDKKLAQFGIEPRVPCGKWAYPWPGAKICVGPGAVEFLQHDFHLVVDGPKPEAAVREVLDEAFQAALAAALATGIATPTPDPASRVTAAALAAKSTFVSYLAVRGLESIVSKYSIRVTHETYWS